MTTKRQKIEAINNSPVMIYVAAAGGGQSFFNKFMQFSGASKTIVGGIIPYSTEQFNKFVKQEITKYCSIDAAVALATSSYSEALSSTNPMNAIGIGITASLSTDDERSGREHHAFISIRSSYTEFTSHIKFSNYLSRIEQEGVISDYVLDLLYSGVDATWSNSKWVENNYGFTISNSESSCKCHAIEAKFTNAGPKTLVVFPGSFNPIHDGHIEIKDKTRSILDLNVHFELSLVNADKGVIRINDVLARRDAIHKHDIPTLVSTNATMLEKALDYSRFCTELIFVVGADTWSRILDPKYAGPIDQLYSQFSELNVKFLVFGRGSLPILTGSIMDNLLLDSGIAAEHNNSMSSTQIRGLQ